MHNIKDLFSPGWDLRGVYIPLGSKDERPRHMLIVQPDLGISKVVVLEVEPEQYVISSSSPLEQEIRKVNLAALGFEDGVAQTSRDLNLN